jgi:hypothetical protein
VRGEVYRQRGGVNEFTPRRNAILNTMALYSAALLVRGTMTPTTGWLITGRLTEG